MFNFDRVLLHLILQFAVSVLVSMFVLGIFTRAVFVVRMTRGSTEVDESFIVTNAVTVSAVRNCYGRLYSFVSIHLH
jgi:hypothetical protein